MEHVFNERSVESDGFEVRTAVSRALTEKWMRRLQPLIKKKKVTKGGGRSRQNRCTQTYHNEFVAVLRKLHLCSERAHATASELAEHALQAARFREDFHPV